MVSRGFSLIELLVVLGIAAILFSIALPSYSSYQVKTERSLAIVALLDLAGRMEQYYSINNKYSGATIENLGFNAASLANFYNLKIKAKTTTYSLYAEPIGRQALNDINCGVLSINELGTKSVSGDDDVIECWE